MSIPMQKRNYLSAKTVVKAGEFIKKQIRKKHIYPSIENVAEILSKELGTPITETNVLKILKDHEIPRDKICERKIRSDSKFGQQLKDLETKLSNMEHLILLQRERILQVETTITLLTDQLTQSNRRLDAHDSYVISHSEKMEGIKTTLKSVSQDINELQSAVVNN